MTIKINSSGASLTAIRRLGDASARVEEAYQRLSSGSRINRASDDPAGLAISSSLNARARVYTQALRNGNDSLSALNIAQGGLTTIGSTLTRIQELATQSANGTFSLSQRKALDSEANALTKEINRLIQSTDFNGLSLFGVNAADLVTQLGFGTNGTIAASTSRELTRQVNSGSFAAYSATGWNSNNSANVVDVDGDGKVDLVTSNTGGAYAMYAKGNGDGTFQAVQTLSTSAGTTSSLVGDFFGDGRLAIAVSTGAGTIEIFRQNADGSFQTAQSYSVSGGANLGDLAVGDFNGDGKLDLAASGVTGTSSIYTLFNNGSGGFTQGITVQIGSAQAGQLEVSDFNNDGISDLVVSGNASSLVANVFLGGRSGQFSRSTTFSVAVGSLSFATGDLNHDGYSDIVFGNGAVKLGRGDGSFLDGNTVSGLVTFSSPITLLDLNGDGALDLAAADTLAGLKVFFGNDDGTFGSASVSTVPGATSGFGFGDFNRDGALDVFYAQGGGSQIALGASASVNTFERVNLLSQSGARGALDTLSTMQLRIQKQLGQIGASMSRVDVALRTLDVGRENFLAAESRIKDSDVAGESAVLIRQKILQSAAVSVLAQANQESTLALTLLRS